MKILRSLLVLLPLAIVGCHDDMDDVLRPADNLEINEFIWRGMNNIYLYKDDIPQLADDYFSTNEELADFLRRYPDPQDLFYDALVSPQDRFSFLVDDYVELEKSFSGISLSPGMDYGLARLSGSNNIIGYVRYVLPNTSAARAEIKRGDIFYAVDGIELTLENYRELLDRKHLNLDLAEAQGNQLVRTGVSISLEQEEYTENPVHLTRVFEISSGKVGYLMYNSFTHNFDSELNQVFGEFKSQGITDLILDLRYNGGGSVETAVDLSSMVTGQFDGEIFAKQQWNEDYQEYFETNDQEGLINRFNAKIHTGEAINSLNLSRLYVLTTGSTASASELVINGLSPYIEVIQVGTKTTGKFQASVTLYDSPDFNRRNASVNHKYAIQPLIYKSMNSAGKTDYIEGLPPAIPAVEDILNLGILGDPDEPLLSAALNHIEGNSTLMMFSTSSKDSFEVIDESGSMDILYQQMYLPELEEGLSLPIQARKLPQ